MSRAAVLLAHRGASAAHPENTLRAFAGAFDEGADGVELDVHLTVDGVPVVFHDRDLTRLTGAPGDLEATPWQALGQRRVGGEPIPSFEQVLNLLTQRVDPAGSFVLNVELKTTPRPQALVEATLPHLTRAAAIPGVALVVSTFDPRVLALAITHRAPGRMALLYEDLAALAALRYLPGGAVVDLHPAHALVTATHLAEYAAPGRLFRAWTVDDPDEARRLLALGVRTLVTNRPQALRDALSGSP